MAEEFQPKKVKKEKRGKKGKKKAMQEEEEEEEDLGAKWTGELDATSPNLGKDLLMISFPRSFIQSMLSMPEQVPPSIEAIELHTNSVLSTTTFSSFRSRT